MSRRDQKQEWAWRQGLTSVILATQEAEIRRTAIQSHPEQIVQETLSQKPQNKAGLAE
jgi:hypothetical protein